MCVCIYVLIFVFIVGLCRTCEIFGASALVLGSLHHVSDKQFQALSVSSELWLPLMEVCICLNSFYPSVVKKPQWSHF